MVERLYWIGFNKVKGIGAARMRSLLAYFGSAESAWRAPLAELRRAGLGEKLAESVAHTRTTLDLEKYWAALQERGIQALVWEDTAYPRRLKEIDQPPPVLYVRGQVSDEDDWAVAVVGTRRITAYGRQVAEEVAGLLARSGVTVVSGLARGVDAVAHLAALNAGRRTIAVLGNGLDQIYPPEHRAMAEKIVHQGALISDYAPGTPPDKVNFPPRNRIISGLALAVVVIEAGERSGALITAQFAAEQGREVFAVPGSITAPQSAGCNRLIQQGARPLLDTREVLQALDLNALHEKRSVRIALPADEVEAKLLGGLSRQPVHVDDLRAALDLPIEKVSAALALMELKGMVRQVGGMHYVLVQEDSGVYRVE
ncbi:MAG: DNA-processing protein DprA [Chloroflexi bacterium]|nr:DNA-processing protein DprA [Chloroflexota bacterium]